MNAHGVVLRRSQRAKRLRLVVKPGVVELVVPEGISETLAWAFLEDQQPWLDARCREMMRRLGQMPLARRFTEQATLPWQGKILPVCVEEHTGRRVHVVVDGAVHIRVPQGLDIAQRETQARWALQRWARRWLEASVWRLVERHALRRGLYPRAIRIKAMKTRWGSLGVYNDINLNWLLALVPPMVLEYVIVHELCHILERNHSPRFWDLVAEHLPHWRESRHWLKTEGVVLLWRFCGEDGQTL